MKPNLKTFAVGVIVFALSAVIGSKRNSAMLAAHFLSLNKHYAYKAPQTPVCSYKVAN